MPDDIWMIEAIIQPFKLDVVTLAIEELPEFRGMTVSDCRGSGEAKLGYLGPSAATRSREASQETRRRRDTDLIDFMPKVKLAIVVAGREAADRIIRTIATTARTGRSGDGMIFAWPLARVVRIRTSEEGESAM